MAELTREQLEERLRTKEQEISAQLDRVYALIKDQAVFEMVKVEFRRTVERITEKYFFIFALLDMDKTTIDPEAFEERAQALRDQYKEDLAVLAAAIDEARETKEP
jgi:hypothetical protein